VEREPASGARPEPQHAPSAAERWEAELAGWGVPPEIIAQAPESPWFHDVRRFSTDVPIDRDHVSHRWAREVLPPTGGTVLDVGCGGGRSALALVPPASELIGVDPSGAMLDEFVAAVAAAGVARRTVHGTWPEVAGVTPVADVAVCHHVVYNVGEIAPFLAALTEHARLAVVLEVSVRHPMAAWAPAWEHFWGLVRPAGPDPDLLVAVLRELGHEPEVTRSTRSTPGSAQLGPDELAAARRRLCLTPDRDAELAAWLAGHPVRFVTDVATLRWPGTAEGG
jgi:SAM-dependent methyltransferase